MRLRTSIRSRSLRRSAACTSERRHRAWLSLRAAPSRRLKQRGCRNRISGKKSKKREVGMSEKVAVIGMGQMGSGMAGRLRESNLDVVGYDISADQCARLAKDGFRMTSNIAEA